MKKKHLLVGAIVLSACGCSTMSHTDRGVLGGGAIGAGTGALIGSATGNAGAGALIGGAVGAVSGGLIGSGVDQAEQRAEARAVERIRYEQAVKASQKPPVTIGDVIHMSKNGVPDDIIIRQIQETNANFNLTSNDIVTLNHAHVSPRVIDEMLKRRPTAPVSQVIHPVPAVERRVIIHEYEPPPPRIHFGIGYNYCRPWRHHHWHCW